MRQACPSAFGCCSMMDNTRETSKGAPGSNSQNLLVFVGDWLPVHPVDVGLLFGESAATVGNLECALSKRPPSATKAYSVVLSMDAVETVAQAGFAALNLANNHVCDAGYEAFQDMVDMLKADKVSTTQYYGTCEQPHAELVVGGLRCAIIGCLEPSRSRGRLLFPQEGVCSLIRELGRNFDRIYITPHWGKEGEYAYHPSPAQRRLAREWLGAGVHGVYGHHTHTMQGMEKAGDGAVVYSLGNFSFPHEEGKRFPLTNVGLSASISPRDNQCHMAFTRFDDDGKITELLGTCREILLEHIQNLSRDLMRMDGLKGYWRWACAIGPTYIEKTSKSWGVRVRKNWKSQLPLWLLWSFLPKTLLLRAAMLAGNDTARKNAMACVNRIASWSDRPCRQIDI